jgi:iron(III) transport system permease protein
VHPRRRGYSVVGGKYGAPRRVEMKRWRWAALAFCLVVLLNPVFLPYFALQRCVLLTRRRW